MNQSFFKRPFFWYGIYFGITSILIFLIEYFLFPELLTNKIASTIISLLPLVIFMTLSGIAEKNEKGGYLTFGKTFRTMFFTSLIGIIIFTVFSHFFNTYYDPDYMTAAFEQQMEETRTKLEDKGMSDEDIDKAMKMSESIYNMKDSVVFKIIGIAFYAGFAALLALLNALFVRKNPPEGIIDSQILDTEN